VGSGIKFQIEDYRELAWESAYIYSEWSGWRFIFGRLSPKVRIIMMSAPRLTILFAACFLSALVLSESTQGQNAMPAPIEDVNGMPTPIVVSKEIHITRQELQEKYPGFAARLKQVTEKDEGLNPNSEKITYRDDIGYIVSYEVLHAAPEGVNANPSLRSFLVLWTKDFETFSAATYSGFDFPNPL
jgi:hypothetical protein